MHDTVEYYTEMRMNELQLHVPTLMKLTNIILSEEPRLIEHSLVFYLYTQEYSLLFYLYRFQKQIKLTYGSGSQVIITLTGG